MAVIFRDFRLECEAIASHRDMGAANLKFSVRQNVETHVRHLHHQLSQAA